MFLKNNKMTSFEPLEIGFQGIFFRICVRFLKADRFVNMSLLGCIYYYCPLPFHFLARCCTRCGSAISG